MTTLRYKAGADQDSLGLGECVVRGACKVSGAHWWMLWFYVARDSDGATELFAVPVAPNGTYAEDGPGGRTWGLTRTSTPGAWQVSPSIDVWSDEDNRRKERGEPRQDPSEWHQTPTIVDVPDGEAWQ